MSLERLRRLLSRELSRRLRLLGLRERRRCLLSRERSLRLGWLGLRERPRCCLRASSTFCWLFAIEVLTSSIITLRTFSLRFFSSLCLISAAWLSSLRLISAAWFSSLRLFSAAWRLSAFAVRKASSVCRALPCAGSAFGNHWPKVCAHWPATLIMAKAGAAIELACSYAAVLGVDSSRELRFRAAWRADEGKLVSAMARSSTPGFVKEGELEEDEDSAVEEDEDEDEGED